MSLKNEQHRKSDPIKITHYVNPHEFWFKYLYESHALCEKEYILEIDKKIEHLSNITKNHYNYSPVKGEIVILRYCVGAVDKLIRARVDCEYKYQHGSEFILWAIDEGFPIRANKKWISQLTSKDLQGENPFVFKGTLNQVVPATVHFNFLESGSEMVKTNCWSQKAINQIEQIISDAETLIFHYDRHAAEQHLFGSIEVISRAGKSNTLNDVLENLKEAVDCKNNFEKEYSRLIHKDYWDNQQEHYKIKENGKHTLPPQDVNVITPKNIQEINIVDKMNDWDKRNKKSIQKVTAENLSQALEKFNLSDLPHNKRYQHIQQSKASDQYSSSNFSQSSSCQSFHTAKPSLPSHNFHFKKALEQESCFSTTRKNKVLMHCPEGVFVSAIQNVRDANFTKEVHHELHTRRITDLYRIQAVSWPHLMRGHSLILVNSAKTSKTWTYLPAVCSLLSEACADGKIVEGDGPVMIIICMNSTDVNTVSNNCYNLLKKSDSKFDILPAFGESENETIRLKLLNGVHILVTTVPCLLRLMADPLSLFKRERIRAIVFDEIDAMCDRFSDKDVDKIYNKFCTENTRIQFIVTSKTWNKVLKKFCNKNDVLLCIGAYIEAAIYSNVKITLQSVSCDDLDEKFLACMKSNNYLYEATIVMCNTPAEVCHIEAMLTTEGASVIFCHDKTDSTKISVINRMINQNKPHDLGVLVCTDDVLRDLNIRNAQHIIHYSLPSVWTAFTERFVASFDYYENLVQDRSSNAEATSVIFVNEESYDSLPRLIQFMRTRCFTKVPEHILQLAERKRIQREEERAEKYSSFCTNLLMFGKCPSESTCTLRHILTKHDRSRENIPRNGDIKFQIIQLHDPVHYTVRLLEHRPNRQNKWQKIPHVEEYLDFHWKFNSWFNNTANHRIHSPPVLDELCVIHEGEGEYNRAKIIHIDRKKSDLKLLLIDSNGQSFCKFSEILVLPEEFKEFPPQAIDIRIGGVVPQDLDPKWGKESTKIVKKWFDDTHDIHIQGKIDFTLMDCIWLESMELIQKLLSIREEVLSLSVNRQIIEHNIGVANTKAMIVLREMAEKIGNHFSSMMKHHQQTNMYSDSDEPINASPHQHNRNLDVSHLKQTYDPLHRRILDKTPHILQIYKSPNEQTQRGERGRRGRGSRGSNHNSSSESIHSHNILLSSSPSKVEREISFNSSNGCLATTSESEEVSGPRYQPLNSSSELSEHVPRMRWAELKPDDFNKVEISKFYAPDFVYVCLRSEIQRVQKLYQKIDEFTSDSKNVKPLAEPNIGQMCLANYNESLEFVRAKILYVEENIVDIFMVDTGVRRSYVPLKHIIAIPQKLIEMLPFQAILCRMVGIRPSNGSLEWSDEKCDESCDKIKDMLDLSSDLIVRTVRDPSISKDVIECNAYDGVYLEKTFETVINKIIVNKNLAEFNPETKHFCDVFVDWSSLKSEDEDWDNDAHHQSFDAGSYLSSSERNVQSIFDSNGNDSERAIDIDIQFSEEDIAKLMGLPPGAKFILDDDNADKCKYRPAIEDVKIEEISCPKPLINEKPKTRISKRSMNIQLIQTAKIPYVTWEQTDEVVTIIISAPDVNDYYLEVGLRYVHLNYKEGEKQFAILLNLFGCVEVDCATHEIRGLNIIVKLLKTLPGRTLRWPRLVQCPDKNRFIRYKLDNFEEYSDDDSGDAQNYNGYLSNSSGTDDDEYDDDESDLIDEVEI